MDVLVLLLLVASSAISLEIPKLSSILSLLDIITSSCDVSTSNLSGLLLQRPSSSLTPSVVPLPMTLDHRPIDEFNNVDSCILP